MSVFLAAGELKHSITIQSRGEDMTDSYGGTVQTWDNVAIVRAKVTPLRARELIEAGSVQSKVTDKFVIRYLPGVTSDMRVQYDSRNYDIDAVIDVKGQGRVMEILAIASGS